METRPLLFIDWDGTLSDGCFWEQLRHTQSDHYERIQQRLFVENVPLVDAWMRDECSSEYICRWLSEQTGISSNILWEELISSCKQMRFDDELRAALRSLQNRFRLILATDNMDCFSRFTVPALKLYELFDDLLISSDLKMLKKDDNGKMFSSYVQNAGVDFSNTSLIDNSSSACELFESLGGQTMKTESVKDTIRHLRNL